MKNFPFENAARSLTQPARMNGAAPIMQARRAQPVATPRPSPSDRARNGEDGLKVKGAATVPPSRRRTSLRRALHPPPSRA